MEIIFSTGVSRPTPAGPSSPDRAGDEVGVVALLLDEQAAAAGLAPADPGDLPEVLEPFDARSDHDQGVRGAVLVSAEGVVAAWRYDQEVAGASGASVRSDQDVERSVDGRAVRGER